MTPLVRFVLRVFLGIAVLSGGTWALRVVAGEAAVPKTTPKPAVSARCVPASPRSLPAFQRNHPAGRSVARPRPAAGFPPVSAVAAPARSTSLRWATPPAVRLSRRADFVGFFLRLVLGHRLAAQAP